MTPKPCILDVLHEDLIVQILFYLDGYSLGRITRTSSTFAKLLTCPHRSQSLWEHVVSKSFHPAALRRVRAIASKSTLSIPFNWRKHFTQTLHVRFDGLYVLKVSYFSNGVERGGKIPSIISYYRYFRFFPRGVVLYALLNYDPDITSNWFSQYGAKVKKDGSVIPQPVMERIRYGKYKVLNGVVTCTVDIGHMVVELRMSFDNIVAGANDRLELVSFTGTTQGEDAVQFPSPSPWFHFRRVIW